MEIYIARSGETLGPYSVEQIKDMVNRKEAFPVDLVWREGMDKWTPLYELPEFSEATAPAPLICPKSDEVTAEDIALFAGRWNKTYVKTWNTPGGWSRNANVGAFFFPVPWLFWRKMYLYGILTLLSLAPVGGIVAIKYGADTGAGVSCLLGFVLSCVCACACTPLYLRHAKGKILKIKQNEKEEAVQKLLIKRAGGTNAYLSLPVAALGCYGTLLLFSHINNNDSSAEPTGSAITDTQVDSSQTPQPALPTVSEEQSPVPAENRDSETKELKDILSLYATSADNLARLSGTCVEGMRQYNQQISADYSNGVVTDQDIDKVLVNYEVVLCKGFSTALESVTDADTLNRLDKISARLNGDNSGKAAELSKDIDDCKLVHRRFEKYSKGPYCGTPAEYAQFVMEVDNFVRQKADDLHGELNAIDTDVSQ